MITRSLCFLVSDKGLWHLGWDGAGFNWRPGLGGSGGVWPAAFYLAV